MSLVVWGWILFVVAIITLGVAAWWFGSRPVGEVISDTSSSSSSSSASSSPFSSNSPSPLLSQPTFQNTNVTNIPKRALPISTSIPAQSSSSIIIPAETYNITNPSLMGLGVALEPSKAGWWRKQNDQFYDDLLLQTTERL